MEKAYFDSPIFSLSPYERLEMEQKAQQSSIYDNDLTEMTQGPFGKFILGNRNTDTGRIGWWAGEFLADPFDDTADYPLNLTKSKVDMDPMRDHVSISMDNNPETITKDLQDVPFEQWSYILSAKTYGQYKDRVRFVKAGLPMAEGLGYGGIVGTLGDVGGMIALGFAGESVALAGLGARTTLAGRAAAASSGTWRFQTPAVAALEAAQTVSKGNLALRFGALGVAEAAVYQAARTGLDPVYEPTAGEVIWELTASGAIGAGLGGYAFGRSLVKDRIEDAARELRASRTVDLPGGYTVTYADRLSFDSVAAADTLLFRGGSLETEAFRIGQDLWRDWQRIEGRVADFAIPGTVPPIRSAIKAAAFELSLAGMRLSDAVFAKVTEALIVTERSKLTGGAFNKKFWEEVSKRIDPEVAAKIRTKDRAFIGGIDRTVQDAVVRDDMIDSIHVAFRNGEHLDPANPKSLIFQVLQEIKARGGTVNRQAIGEIVDELRAIAQKPPTRVNAKGKEVLDTNARRLAVAQIVNKRVKEGKGIYIPDSLLKKMTAVPGARTATGEVVDFIGPRQQTPSGLAPDATFDSAPKASRFLIEKLPFWSAIGNQAARVLESNNGAARTIAWLGFNARRSFGVAQKQTVMEAGTATLHMLMFGFLRGYRNQYIRFALGNGNANAPVEQVNLMGLFKTAFGKSEVRREFNKRVAQQLRTGTYDDALESVNEAAKGFRELLNKVHNIAEQAGVRGFTKSAVVNYMPRLWRFDKIRRLATTEEGKKDLIALVRQAMDQRGRRVVIDGVEQTFTEDIDQAAIAFSNRLIAIATKTENAPTLQHEQELFDALSELAGPIKPNTPSRTPFGRGRILIDETSSVRMTGDHLGDGKATLSIADLTNDDLPFVFRKYLTSVMGAVNERRLISAFNDELRIRGILGPRYVTKDGEVLKDVVEVNTVDEMLGLARKIGGEIEAGHEQGLREVIAALRYEPIHSGSAGLMDRVLGIMIPYGYLTTGGQFGLAAFGEVSRLVSTLGWRQILRQMPIMSEMIGNYKNLDRESKNFASFIDTWFAPSTDRLRRSFMDVTGSPSGYDTGGGLGYRYAKRAVDGASNVLSDISGLAPITSFTQQLAAAGILQHLYDVSKGAKRMSAATIRTLGLEPDEYERVIKFVAENAEVRRGFMGDRITGLKNLDAVEMDLVKSLVQRTVTTRIQDVPTRGDFHKNLFSWWGRLLTQFQTFNLKGVDNFLIQNAGRARNGASAEVVQDIGATMLLAGTIQYLRTYADYESYKAAGDKEKMEEAEERLTIGGFFRGATNGPAEFFLPVRATDAFWTNFVDEDPLFSQYRYSGLGWAGFPGEAMVRRAWEVRGDLYGASVGKKFDLTLEREITRGTLHKMRLLAPAQNLPGLKHYFNILEDEIADAYGLPEQQPRRKKNKD